MKKYIFLIASVVFVSCSSPKDPFENNRTEVTDKVDNSQADTVSRTITISLSNGAGSNSRLVGNKMDNSRGIYFTWSAEDEINLVYSQNGRCYKLSPLRVMDIEKNWATIKPVIPQGIDKKQPFDIYGFVGKKASWVEPISGAVPSLKIQQPTTATTNIEDATREIPMYFSLKNVTTDMVKCTLHHLGMMVAVSVVNNTNHTNPQRLDVNKVVLFMRNGANSTIPKSQNGQYTFNFTNNIAEKVDQLEFECRGRTLYRRDEATYYSWVYYPDVYNTNNVDVSFDVYANGRKFSLVGSHNVKSQSTGLSYNYCTSYYEDRMYAIKAVPREIKGSEWMKHIEDDRPFLSLLLTGTHDAATFNNNWGAALGYVKCQDKSFTEQFNCGVRALDLRPKVNKNNNDIEIYHGPRATGIFMSQAFNDAISFLKENPSETVLFLIKDENSEGGKNINLPMVSLITKYESHIYRKDVNWNTKLSDVRGKIILLFRDELLANTNNLMYVGPWYDNTTYGVAGIYKVGGSQDNWNYSFLFDVILEDNYSGPKTKDKIWHYKHAVQQSLEQKTWNLSYLSATKILGWGPWEYAQSINPQITDYYKNEVDVNYNGITFMDFAGYNYGNHNGEELVRQMYLNNFKKPWNR